MHPPAPSTHPAGASSRASSPCSPSCRRICLAGSAGRSWASKWGDDGIVLVSPNPPSIPSPAPSPPAQLGSPLPAGIRTRLPAPRVPVQPIWQRLRAVPALEGLCGGTGTPVSASTRCPPSPRASVRPSHGFCPGEGTAAVGMPGLRGSHRTAGGPDVVRRRCHPGAGRTSSSSGARGCSGAGAGGLRAQGVTLGDGAGTGKGREGTAGCRQHSQNKSISRMASLAWGGGRMEKDGEGSRSAAAPSSLGSGARPRCQRGVRPPLPSPSGG